MQMTGHSKESTFMTYIGRDPNRDAYANTFMEGVIRIDKNVYSPTQLYQK